MIYQYPQPWLQRLWQQQVQPPKTTGAGALGAPSAGMPMGMGGTKGGLADPVHPWMSSGVGMPPMGMGKLTPMANAFASPQAFFASQRRARQRPQPQPFMRPGGI